MSKAVEVWLTKERAAELEHGQGRFVPQFRYQPTDEFTERAIIYIPEEGEPRFKKGDRVQRIDTGKTGTVAANPVNDGDGWCMEVFVDGRLGAGFWYCQESTLIPPKRRIPLPPYVDVEEGEDVIEAVRKVMEEVDHG